MNDDKQPEPFIRYDITDDDGNEFDGEDWQESCEGINAETDKEAKEIFNQLKIDDETSHIGKSCTLSKEIIPYYKDEWDEWELDFDNAKIIENLDSFKHNWTEYKNTTTIKDWCKSQNIDIDYEYSSNSSEYLGFDLVDFDMENLSDEKTDNLYELNRVVVRISDHESNDFGTTPLNAQTVTDYLSNEIGEAKEFIDNYLIPRQERINEILETVNQTNQELDQHQEFTYTKGSLKDQLSQDNQKTNSS